MKYFPLVMGVPILAVQTASAALFEFDFVRAEPIDFHQSMAVDSATGRYYSRAGLGLTGSTVLEYNNAAAFETGNPSRAIELQNNYFGTYVAANNGMLYGRTQLNDDSSGAGSSRINLSTGVIEQSNPFSSYLGRNGDDTFAWGGLTSMNFYNDPAGLFALGKTADVDGQTWSLNRLDQNLNILESKTFDATEIGFAVMVNGQLLIGQHTYDIDGNLHTDGFSSMFDFATGQYNSVDHAFSRLGDTQYIDNLLYDPATDTIYAHNRAGGEDAPAFYKMGDVSKVLSGEIKHSVPEPLNTLAFLSLAAVGLFVISRPARSAKS